MFTIKNHQTDIENKLLICSIEYPAIQNKPNDILIQYINKQIHDDVTTFKDIHLNQQKEQNYNLLIFIDYEITLNKNDIISIPIVFSESIKYNRLVTYVNTYNYDINQHKKIELKDLFKPNFDYKSHINNHIENESQTQFIGITENQTFYITPESLIICFSSYEYSNYPGTKEYEILFKSIENNLSEYTKKYIME